MLGNAKQLLTCTHEVTHARHYDDCNRGSNLNNVIPHGCKLFRLLAIHGGALAFKVQDNGGISYSGTQFLGTYVFVLRT